MQLKEIMSPTSSGFAGQDSILSVTEALAHKHHSCAIICSEHKPIGILTERDIVKLFGRVARGELDGNSPIADVMTYSPICVTCNVELTQALEMAKQSKLRHLPIVDDQGLLTGVVTMTDMVKAYLASVEKQSVLASENELLHVLSLEDPLTTLPNRRAMEIELKHRDALAQRNGIEYCIALMDIDYFKKFNDYYGHQAGDDALVHVASIIKKCLRSADKAFRYGGEEFLLVMSGTDGVGAVKAAERIRNAIFTSQFEHCKSPFSVLSVSIGVAAHGQEQWERVVELADQALYHSKSEGRNRVELSTYEADFEADSFVTGQQHNRAQFSAH